MEFMLFIHDNWGCDHCMKKRNPPTVTVVTWRRPQKHCNFRMITFFIEYYLRFFTSTVFN